MSARFVDRPRDGSDGDETVDHRVAATTTAFGVHPRRADGGAETAISAAANGDDAGGTASRQKG